MDFDKKKCFELMKESNKLRQKGKFLQDFDKAKNRELIQYLTLLDDQIFWQSRGQYFQILELFVDKIITVDEFIQQFDQLQKSNRDASKMWKENLETEACAILPKASERNVQLDSQSHGFSEIISSIDTFLELFDPDITLERNLKWPDLIGYGISEELLRVTIKDDFLPQIVDYCKES